VTALAAAAAAAALLWLPNPHNPTGTVVPPRELEWLVEQLPESCVVVLDEAYRGFADADALPDAEALLSAHPNVVVQRTLSKDWALAGIRLGYGLASPEIVSALQRVRAPFSVGAPALAAGRAVLRDGGWRTMSVERVRHERVLLEATLRDLGLEFYPSQANFVLVRVPHAVLAPHLAEAGLSVRPGEDLGTPGWVRISIGWAPTMTLLRGALRRAAADTDPSRRPL
jgi:histidinol-phosphate aminotransferase